MVLGMSLSMFTTVHVIISLIAIVGGHHRHVRPARLQPDAGADRDIPAVHDPDQCDRFLFPLSICCHRI